MKHISQLRHLSTVAAISKGVFIHALFFYKEVSCAKLDIFNIYVNKKNIYTSIMSQISVLKQKMLIIIHKCPFDVRTKVEICSLFVTA